METITERSIENHLLDLIEEWKADLFDLNFKDVDGWDEGNRVVASAQYAYIKFGLMNGDAQDSHPVEPEVDNRVTPEMSQILDEVELQWLEPKSAQITCEFILDLVHKMPRRIFFLFTLIFYTS